MRSTAESPHRAAAGIEKGEGPIAPRTRGHNGGRKASNVKKEFTAVPDVGGTCLHCHVLVKTRAPRHRGHSRGASYGDDGEEAGTLDVCRRSHGRSCATTEIFKKA